MWELSVAPPTARQRPQLRMRVGRDPRSIMRLVLELFEGAEDAKRQLEGIASVSPGDKDSFYSALYLGLFEESRGRSDLSVTVVCFCQDTCAGLATIWILPALLSPAHFCQYPTCRRAVHNSGNDETSLRWIRRSLDTRYAEGSFDFMVDVARVHLSQRTTA